jgi:N-dimethylarginine dimethylaminohydrolase
MGDVSAFTECRLMSIAASRTPAMLRIAGTIIHPAHFSLTRARLEAEGLRVAPLAMAELAKAEAGVTCCSLLVSIG